MLRSTGTNQRISLLLLGFLGLVYLSLQVQPAQGAPVSSSTLEPPKRLGWASEPGTRGTSSLLISSLFTFLLCVWTTIHVNLEPPPETVKLHDKLFPILKGTIVDRILRKRWARKLGWGYLALLHPEVAMWIAFFELQVANLVCKQLVAIEEARKLEEKAELKKAAEGIDSDQLDKEISTISTRQSSAQLKSANEEFDEVNYKPRHRKLGFYVVMGGFVLDPAILRRLTVSYPSLLKNYTHRTTLTTQGVLACAEIGCLPKISIDAIRDKSNADRVSKFLICVQAAWMIIQVIGRRATSLPVTLLELHVVLQAACAVLMYALWWDKPVDIQLPTTVFMTPAQEAEFTHMLITALNSPHQHDPTSPVKGYHFPKKLLASSAGLGKMFYEHIFGDSDEFSFWDIIVDDFVGINRRLYTALHFSGTFSVVLSLLSITWGALHLVAWETHNFPTEIEAILWRVSALYTAATMTGLLVYMPLGAFVTEEGTKRWIYKVYWNTGYVMWILGYFPCVLMRKYLLVESFISVRSLEEKAYRTVKWAEVLPHV